MSSLENMQDVVIRVTITFIWDVVRRCATDDNIFLGRQAAGTGAALCLHVAFGLFGNSLTAGCDNIFIGKEAGSESTTCCGSVLIGSEAGKNNDASYNVSLGMKVCRGSSTLLIILVVPTSSLVYVQDIVLHPEVVITSLVRTQDITTTLVLTMLLLVMKWGKCVTSNAVILRICLLIVSSNQNNNIMLGAGNW